MAETLNGKGDFTVFAPTNAAFDKLEEKKPGTIAFLLDPENKDALAAVLLRHVLDKRIMAGDIPSGITTVTTLSEDQIDVINNGNGVSIKSAFLEPEESANVIATDIDTSNGVVHLVDTVF